MMLSPAQTRSALLLFLCLGLAGCLPTSFSGNDELKDPHFLTGRSRKMALDYTGAADAFEKALEVNPRSAAAHFEMGMLCYENLNDPAAAIYHFDRYLKLRPDSNKADMVRQFIAVSKQELVKGVPLGVVNEQFKREVERLVQEKERLGRENNDLHQQVTQLKSQLGQRAGPAGPTGTNNTPVTAPRNPLPALPYPVAPASPGGTLAQASAQVDREDTRPAASPKTYVVRTGDTPYSIARSFGVDVAALLGANPGTNPKRLRPGQSLAIPLR
jgi:tetratricopeptide (TPR) repeat protein